MDTKLSMKVDIYVEWNKKLQQITDLKKLKYHKHHKIYKVTIFYCLTHLLFFFPPTFIGCVPFDHLFILQWFVISSIWWTEGYFSLSCSMVDQNLFFVTDG